MQPQQRPEIPPHIQESVERWWADTDHLVQRRNALFEFREANKALFPARFNPNDPRRGQVPHELRSGRDTRRVQTPLIYRGTIQITAMSVPDDLDFSWDLKPQAKPPLPVEVLMMGMQAQSHLDVNLRPFAETLTIVQRELLREAEWIKKLRAWVQDSDTYPAAVLKIVFRRDFSTQTLSQSPLDRDATDALANAQALLTAWANREFDENDARYQHMLQAITALQSQARILRWYGLDIQLISLDSFGILEDVSDQVNVYEAGAMFQDALLTGEEILKRYPYREENGETFGVLREELESCIPWNADHVSTDPNARNRISRNRQMTAPAVSASGGTHMNADSDSLRRRYLVREIWCKRDRTVYTLIRGLHHFVDRYIPQKRNHRWYPFYFLAPNRVPGELYGASSVELKRDIQARIHRKRTDEEKARWLALPRGIYNRAAGTDEKEMVKLQDIQPGELRGINFGTLQQKIDDLVQWWSYEYNPESFNTVKDEQDLDLMGSLPVQALGQTGSANFATEVSVAATGSQIAAQFRKSIIREAIDDLLTRVAQELIQELTLEEVQRIAGPHAVWPVIYDEMEALQILQQEQAVAMQAVAMQVLQMVQEEMLVTGVPPHPDAVRQRLEAAAAPLWQSAMIQKYGAIEPTTRESLFQRLKVEVKSSFSGRIDRQQSLQMFAMLAESCMQIGQVAANLGQPFNLRPILLYHADLVGGQKIVEEAFPIMVMSPGMTLPPAAGGPPQAGPGSAASRAPAPHGPEQPENQAVHGQEVVGPKQAANALLQATAMAG